MENTIEIMEKYDKAKLKYDINRLALLITEFIAKAPAFDGDNELIELIGTSLGRIQGKINETIM